jgi:hypothetical protein
MILAEQKKARCFLKQGLLQVKAKVSAAGLSQKDYEINWGKLAQPCAFYERRRVELGWLFTARVFSFAQPCGYKSFKHAIYRNVNLIV